MRHFCLEPESLQAITCGSGSTEMCSYTDLLTILCLLSSPVARFPSFRRHFSRLRIFRTSTDLYLFPRVGVVPGHAEKVRAKIFQPRHELIPRCTRPGLHSFPKSLGSACSSTTGYSATAFVVGSYADYKNTTAECLHQRNSYSHPGRLG